MAQGPQSVVAIVPVRVGSQRLPGKALLAESGKPLFIHTCEASQAATQIDQVYVATDDERVLAAAEEHGIQALRTSDRPETGSERCAEAARELDATFIIDVQGDWPEVSPADLDRMATELVAGRARCNTLAAPLSDQDRIADPNVVKVVRAPDGHAIYFSRAAVPHDRAGNAGALRHIGVYGFATELLHGLQELPSSELAARESLEQLRWLENRIPIQVLDAEGDPWGIETRSDYEAFLARIQP